MARLAFCDYHNMVAILKKYEHNQDFHQIVDFPEASNIRYALTFNPTVYVSYIRQFWSTARIETTEEGTKILATIDGKLRTISESSVMRNLKLNDEAGISSLPDAKLFENLTLMGYNISPNQKFTFQKGQFFRSGTLTEPHHTPSLEVQQTSPTTHSSPSVPPITTEPLPTITPSDTPQLRQYTRRARIAQSSALLTAVDEPASPLGDGGQGEAFSTVTSLVARQDRANIVKTSTFPSDLTPRVTSFAADEGSMQHQIQELIALCTGLQRVMLLEDREGGGIAQSGDDALIEERSLDEREATATEKSAKKGIDDSEEMVTVLTSLDAATILSSGVAEVPTCSGSIPTAGPPANRVPTGSDVVPTASPIFTTATESTPYTRRKGKEKIEYHQFATELPIVRRIELISDLVKYQENYAKVLKFQTQQRKPLPMKQQKDFYMSALKSQEGWKARHFKGITLEEIKEKFDPVWKQFQDFILIVKEVYMEALQVKHQIIDWEVHTEGERSYWKILRLGGSTASYQFFVDLLKHFDREDLNQLWALVKETLNIRPATNDEKDLWVELKRLYKPDVEDLLWTHTQNLMHAPVEWKLYDTCGGHHVISKDQEIFMLVEKDYPLRKGLAIVMICYKLQVENYSQMANDLILKIYKIANSPRQQDD
nr:hypothetical protein [Tanacetum cinerariifolium]